MEKRILSLCLLLCASLITFAQHSELKVEKKAIDLDSEDVKGAIVEKNSPQFVWVDVEPVNVPNGYDTSQDNSLSIRTFRLTGANCAPMPNALKKDPEAPFKSDFPKKRIIRFVPDDPGQEKP